MHTGIWCRILLRNLSADPALQELPIWTVPLLPPPACKGPDLKNTILSHSIDHGFYLGHLYRWDMLGESCRIDREAHCRNEIS